MQTHTVSGDEVCATHWANALARVLIKPANLAFSGDIGAGKTTFIRAMLQAQGITTRIKSPTFSLVESYNTNDTTFHHFDLYRIEDISELDYIGFRDYFSKDSICCIEWPEKVGVHALNIDLLITFHIEGTIRRMTFEALSMRGETMLSNILAKP